MATTRTEFWQDRPTLVTGAAGLVGSWLVKQLLEAGASVVCLLRDQVPHSELVRSGAIEEVRVVRGDVCDQALLERAITEYEVDTVLHLAAQSIVGTANRNPAATFRANVGGTYTLLEACRRTAVARQIVVASSDKAYGDQEQLPYTESAPLQGRHPYDVSKSCTDLIAQAYATTYGLPVAITRCGNIFGGGDLNWSRLVPGTIRSALRGERPLIRSDGEFVRDYLYVEDGAGAYLTLVEKLAAQPELVGEPFNFSLGVRLTVHELVREILRLTGSDAEPVVLGEASNEIRLQYLSSAKAQRVLGWSPEFDLETGLRRTIDWYRDYFNSDTPA